MTKITRKRKSLSPATLILLVIPAALFAETATEQLIAKADPSGSSAVSAPPAADFVIADAKTPEAPDGDVNQALVNAIAKGHLKTANYWIKQGASVNAQDEHTGQSALMIAAAKGYADLVEVLIDRGANTEDKDFTGHTALMFAAGSGNMSTVTLLLRKGAQIDAQSEDGTTPLIAAAKRKNKAIYTYLREHQANLEPTDVHGLSAYDYASGIRPIH